jgi:hypothetical protein
MDALELAARYSFMPNRLRYCGPEDADKLLFDYVITKKGRENVKDVLNRFEALSLYLNLIAGKNNLVKFDKNVIEAYWIGNSLLDAVLPEDIRQMILNDFTKKGLPKSIAQKLSKNLPDSVTAHHSFHVMHIHSITGKLKFTFSNIDKCRISSGTVRKIMENKLAIEYEPVEIQEKISIGKPVTKEISYDKKFLGTIKIGDTVAVHWDYAVQKITGKQKKNLEKYTQQNLSAINSL